jgi:hypothetical protein
MKKPTKAEVGIFCGFYKLGRSAGQARRHFGAKIVAYSQGQFAAEKS